MRVLLVPVVIASLTLLSDIHDQAGFEDHTSTVISAQVPVWDRPQAELYSNGPWFNSIGTGYGGADESILQTVTLGMYTHGFNINHNVDCIMADDFVIPTGEAWTIQSITCFCFQNTSSTTPTIGGLYLAVYDGPPTGDPSLVWGDLSTNLFSSVAWTNVYRVTETSTGTPDRPIMAVTAELDQPLVLGEGSYWLHIQAVGYLSSGPWAPPISVMGESTTGDAYHYFTGSWGPALDITAGTPQGIPFILEGLPTALECDSWGTIKSAFSVLTEPPVLHTRLLTFP